MKRMIAASFVTAFLVTAGVVFAQEGSAGVIAIASSGKTLSASVSSQAGRSPYFLLVDKQGALLDAVENPYKDAGNAGIRTLDFLAGKGVNVLVAEGFGSRILEVMKEKRIRPVEFKGTAKNAVQRALEAK